MNHTPGPWFVMPAINCGFLYIETGDPGKSDNIASIELWNRELEVDEANARLIAAAPDMLRLLHKIAYEPIGDALASANTILDDIREMAREMVAKVTEGGESKARVMAAAPGLLAACVQMLKFEKEQRDIRPDSVMYDAVRAAVAKATGGAA